VLGATICAPRGPACARCPLRAICRAHRERRVDDFPPVVARRAPESGRRAVALSDRGGRVLMERREGALLGGLWEPPGVELANGASPASALRASLARLGVRGRLAPTGRTVRHTITHRAISVEVWQGALVGAVPRRAHLRWVDPARPAVPLTALARKLTSERQCDPPRTGERHGRRTR